MQRQIQGFLKREVVGCRVYGYFIHGQFVSEHIMPCTDKMPVEKTPDKIVRKDKMLAILWDMEKNMPILSKNLVCRTDGQVN